MFDWRMSAFQPLSARGLLTNRNVFGISWHSVQRVYVLQWVTHEGVKQLHIKYFRVLAILIERHFTAPTGNLMFATNCHEFFGLPFGIGKRDSVCWAGYTTAFQYIYILMWGMRLVRAPSLRVKTRMESKWKCVPSLLCRHHAGG